MFKVEDYRPLSYFSKNKLSKLMNLNISNTDRRDNGTTPKSRFALTIANYLDGYPHTGFLSRFWNDDKIIAWAFLEEINFNLEFTVYVIPEFRERKIGSYLFGKAINYAKEKGYPKLTTHQWNKNSFEFYSSLKKHGSTTISKQYIPFQQNGKMEFFIDV